MRCLVLIMSCFKQDTCILRGDLCSENKMEVIQLRFWNRGIQMDCVKDNNNNNRFPINTETKISISQNITFQE